MALCRLFIISACLSLIFLAGLYIYLLNENPDSLRPLVSDVENWWDGVSTAVSAYGIYGGGGGSNDDDGASTKAIRGSNNANVQKLTHHNDETTFQNQQHFKQGLPNGLTKYPFMLTEDDIDDEERVCFVNIGKTAGSSVACSLGFAYDQCPIEHVRIPNGNLPQFATSMMHKELNDCQDYDFEFYMVSVRDPLERLKSWFAYERLATTSIATTASNDEEDDDEDEIDELYAKRKQLFLDCPFHTMEDLGGELGLGGNKGNVCCQRAWDAVQGIEPYSDHNYYNFGYYYDQVLEMDRKPRIVVLRTEHLEQDWTAIETELLDGPEPFPTNFSFPQRHSSYRRPEDSTLSVESRTNICLALCQEIQIYKVLLELAENLSEDDYFESMRELRKQCPDETVADHC